MNIDLNFLKIPEEDSFKVEKIIGGGNSRVYKLKGISGRNYAAKAYPFKESGGYDRLACEYSAIKFLSEDKRLLVPRPMIAYPNRSMALYEWIEGDLPSLGESSILAMINFLEILTKNKERALLSGEIKVAAESCLSPLDISNQINQRLDRLSLVDDEPLLKPAIDRIRGRLMKYKFEDAILDKAYQCLSPGDFGIHNMIFSRGEFYFIDMEYFGWDDPVKLISDMLWHPRMSFNAGQVECVLSNSLRLYGEDKNFKSRFQNNFLAFGLRWSTILLNEFLPEKWKLREHAGHTDWQNKKMIQLEKFNAFVGKMDGWNLLISKFLKKH